MSWLLLPVVVVGIDEWSVGGLSKLRGQRSKVPGVYIQALRPSKGENESLQALTRDEAATIPVSVQALVPSTTAKEHKCWMTG